MLELADAVIAGVAGFSGSLLTWHFLTAPRVDKSGMWVSFRAVPLPARNPRPGVFSRLWAKLIAPVIALASKARP